MHLGLEDAEGYDLNVNCPLLAHLLEHLAPAGCTVWTSCGAFCR